MDSEEDNFYRGGQKHYKILKEEDIKHLQENDISTVSGVLSVSRGVACALLCENNWCLTSVYEKWFAAEDDGERNSDPAVKSAEQESTKQLCNICYSKIRPKKMVSAACGHLFCTRCWKTYIKTAVSDGAACLTLRCPDPGCRAAVTFDIVERLASKAVFNKYHRFLLRSYVESNRSRKWCPSAGCDRAVEYEGIGSEGYDVVCDCLHKFCWNCTEEHHRPVECKTVAEWAEKNRSEAENTMWILTYTKPCPKCKRPIEKNQGCNHMTCKSPCKFEFCWMCGEKWKGHNNFFSCNKYKKKIERDGKDEDERNKKKAKRLMERYSHYYERWVSNDKSRKIAMEDLKWAESRCAGKMEFVVKAWEQIVECRRVLKWSYVYGFYLSEEEDAKRDLFVWLQAQAEKELERLHHCVEKEMIDEGIYVDSEVFGDFKMKLVNLTSSTGNYFENLVVGLENNLVEVDENNASSSKRKRNGRSSEMKKKKKRGLRYIISTLD